MFSLSCELTNSYQFFSLSCDLTNSNQLFSLSCVCYLADAIETSCVFSSNQLYLNKYSICVIFLYLYNAHAHLNYNSNNENSLGIYSVFFLNNRQLRLKKYVKFLEGHNSNIANLHPCLERSLWYIYRFLSTSPLNVRRRANILPHRHGLFIYHTLYPGDGFLLQVGAAVGRVVRLLACGARGSGFDPRPRHLNFQRLVISCFQVEIWLKDRLIDGNPQNNQPTYPSPGASRTLRNLHYMSQITYRQGR